MGLNDDDPRLSEWGHKRVHQLARKRAQQVDDRNSTWRYHADWVLLAVVGIGRMGFSLSLLFSLFLAAFVLVSSYNADILVGGVLAMAVNGGIALVAYWIHRRVRNDEVQACD